MVADVFKDGAYDERVSCVWHVMVRPAQVLQLGHEAGIQNLAILEVLLRQSHLSLNQIGHDLFDADQAYLFIIIENDPCLLLVLLDLTWPVCVTFNFVDFLRSRQHDDQR